MGSLINALIFPVLYKLIHRSLIDTAGTQFNLRIVWFRIITSHQLAKN